MHKASASGLPLKTFIFMNRFNNNDNRPTVIQNGGMAAHDLRNMVLLPGAAQEEEVGRRRPRAKRLDEEDDYKVSESFNHAY